MVNSYDDIMGSPMDVDTHPSRQMAPPTQQYAGDVVSMPGSSTGAGPTTKAAPYATGKDKDPKVLSIGMPTLKGWADRRQNR